ncbi:GNAT family N-acetyltransferase [Methanoregula sp.]|jgi:GNAT superfamily N-acetyltransferase|uniref:GNAT family N-acetyltransferase n=1 Tax=Methanoregula sp. TaxID=2052170 RepID=UPI003C1EDBA5
MNIDLTSLVFSKLTDDSDVSMFTCSDSEDLEDFLRNDAKTRQHEKISTTYLVHSGTELVGFFSLSMGCIVSDHVKKMLPAVEEPPQKYPALLLARMATRDGMRGQGVGYEMLKHVFALAFILTDQIGCRFVKVDAKKDPRTIRFYETYGGFVKITEGDDTVQMVVDINKIVDE